MTDCNLKTSSGNVISFYVCSYSTTMNTHAIKTLPKKKKKTQHGDEHSCYQDINKKIQKKIQHDEEHPCYVNINEKDPKTDTARR